MPQHQFCNARTVVPQILEALPLDVQMGLRLPLVYNPGAYDSLESIRLMGGESMIWYLTKRVWQNAACWCVIW